MSQFLLVTLLFVMAAQCSCYSREGSIALQMLRPMHSIEPDSKINKKMDKTDTLLYKTTQELYPGHFFLHMHTPKTGGTTFKDIIAVTDNKKYNCGYPSANYPSEFSIGDLVDSDGCTYFTYEMREVDKCEARKKDNCLLGNYVTQYECDHRCVESNMDINYNAKTNTSIHVMNIFRSPTQHILSAIAHIAKHKNANNNRCGNLHEYITTDGECRTYPIENMQTHVMSHPVSIEVALRKLDKLFFVGILELYEPSVCVLGYQLGQFNKERCDCNNEKGISAHSNVHHYSKTDPASIVIADDLSKVQSKILLDNYLYNAALEITIARIEHVERKTGIRIMCDSYKDSLHNMVFKNVEVVEKFV